MKAGGIESVRWPMIWSAIQPTAHGGYDWSAMDQVVAVASRAGLSVLPSIGSTPGWLTRKSTTLPVENARQEAAWSTFLQAASRRYGPGGEFWSAHLGAKASTTNRRSRRRRRSAPGRSGTSPTSSTPPIPSLPARYAKLVEISNKAIKEVDPQAKTILAGLFGKPSARGARGMPAAGFLERPLPGAGTQIPTSTE